jgi:hypothetical protein
LQYIAEHPQTLPEEEIAVLMEMAAMGARRCSKCHYIGIKEEGCAHMFCEQCYHHYDWRQAEKVLAPRSKAIELERSRREHELSRQ